MTEDVFIIRYSAEGAEKLYSFAFKSRKEAENTAKTLLNSGVADHYSIKWMVLVEGGRGK